jgi:hypothetical protein
MISSCLFRQCNTRILFTSLSKNTTLSEQTRGNIYATIKPKTIRYYTAGTNTRKSFTSLSKHTTLSEQTRGYYLRHYQTKDYKILHCRNRHEEIIYVTVKKYYTVWADTRKSFTSLSKNTTLSEQTRGYYLRHCQKILHYLNRHEDIIYVTVKKYYTVWTDTRKSFTSLSKNTTLSEHTRGYYLGHCQKILHYLNRHEDIIYVTQKRKWFPRVCSDSVVFFDSDVNNILVSAQTV